MIAVYIAPGTMQILQGTRKGDKLIIRSAQNIRHAYFDILQKVASDGKYDSEDAHRLSGLFYEIKEVVDERSPLHVVLPDFLFSKTDCLPYQSDDDIVQYLRRSSRGEEGYYYSVPLLIVPVPTLPTSKRATVYALYREIVDILVAAAEEESTKILSVEPASLAYLRASGSFIKEEICFYCFESCATFVAYSSIAGICKMDLPALSAAELRALPLEKQEESLREELLNFEMTATETFKFFNQGLPITVFAAKQFSEIPVFADRSPESICFPSYIEDPGILGENRHRFWMSAAGTLLQDVDFSKEAFSGLMDLGETLRSANILPEAVRQSVQQFQYLDRLEKFFQRLRLFCSFLFLPFSPVSFFFRKSEFLKSWRRIMRKPKPIWIRFKSKLPFFPYGKKEHEQPLEGLASCLATKPETVYFIQFHASAPKNVKDPWIRLKVTSPEALVFQDYLSSLSKSSRFSEVTISEIGSDSASGYKTAEIIFRKETHHE